MEKEVFDKELKFAEKYNWWTPEEMKAGISIITKIEYIMLRWTDDELDYVYRNFDKKLFITAFHNVEDDWYSLKPRRKWAIKGLISLYK